MFVTSDEIPRVGQMANYKQYRGCLITDVDEVHKRVLLIVQVTTTTAVQLAFKDLTNVEEVLTEYGEWAQNSGRERCV